MLSKLLELSGYGALVAVGTLIGVLIGGLIGAFIAGLAVLGPVLVLLGVAAEKPKR